MKWLGIIGIFLLAGCQEDALEPEVRGLTSADAKSFSAPPNELKAVLAGLRKETGWTLTCDPDLDHELVYLKFKDKSEREVAQALGQVLIANFPEKNGAITLSASHAKQIRDIIFQNEIYRGRIQPRQEELSKDSAKTAFQPGFAAEKLRESMSLLKQTGESHNPEDQRLRQLITPQGRAAAALFSQVPEEDFRTLALGEPKIWATTPSGGQLKMTEPMEAIIDQFVRESMEWNGALAAAQSRHAVDERMPQPLSFSPRDDFEFRLTRGDPQIADAFTLRVEVTSKSKHGLSQPISWITVPLLTTTQPVTEPAEPAFEKAVRDTIFERETGRSPGTQSETSDRTSTGRSVADVRLQLLQMTLEASANHADNIVANLDSQVLDQMARLTMLNRRPNQELNPDEIIKRHHAKFVYPAFVSYRPYFPDYARLDRAYWTEHGSGVLNSPWSGSPSPSGDSFIEK